MNLLKSYGFKIQNIFAPLSVLQYFRISLLADIAEMLISTSLQINIKYKCTLERNLSKAGMCNFQNYTIYRL